MSEPAGSPSQPLTVNGTRLQRINGRTAALVRALGASTEREKQFLLNEILAVKGLMPLLMKPRNRQRWSAEDKAELARHLKRLSQLSPYLVVVAMPGGLLMLPALAWWLDRRRKRSTPLPARREEQRP